MNTKYPQELTNLTVQLQRSSVDKNCDTLDHISTFLADKNIPKSPSRTKLSATDPVSQCDLSNYKYQSIMCVVLTYTVTWHQFSLGSFPQFFAQNTNGKKNTFSIHKAKNM